MLRLVVSIPQTLEPVALQGRIVDLNPQDILTETGDAAELVAAEPEIIAHMNGEHADAVRLFATFKFDAVVLDIMGVDGHSLLARFATLAPCLMLTAHALTPEVPRIAVKPSRFDGLLLFPTRKARTVVIYKIGRAAAKTKDLLFTFGTGRPERACVFMDFFLAFMQDLQRTLREAQPKGSRADAS